MTWLTERSFPIADPGANILLDGLQKKQKAAESFSVSNMKNPSAFPYC